jgi:hypothetical protein
VKDCKRRYSQARNRTPEEVVIGDIGYASIKGKFWMVAFPAWWESVATNTDDVVSRNMRWVVRHPIDSGLENIIAGSVTSGHPELIMEQEHRGNIAEGQKKQAS